MSEPDTIETISYVLLNPDENPEPGTKLFLTEAGKFTAHGTWDHCAVTIGEPFYQGKFWMVKAETFTKIQ